MPLLNMSSVGLGVQVPGNKALVLDPKISGPLALVAQTSLLKVGEHLAQPQSYAPKP